MQALSNHVPKLLCEHGLRDSHVCESILHGIHSKSLTFRGLLQVPVQPRWMQMSLQASPVNGSKDSHESHDQASKESEAQKDTEESTEEAYGTLHPVWPPSSPDV